MGKIREALLKWTAETLGTDPQVLAGDHLQRTTFTPEEMDDYIQIEDHGAEITVFAFSGLAAVFAGLPSFEFNRQLRESGHDFNFVFLRDIRRMCYHLRPNGQTDGLAFFEAAVRKAKESLGARYNVALGTSVGGSAALYFAIRCGMDQAIAFSPGYPLTVYCGRGRLLRNLCDLPALIRDRRAYCELLLTSLGTRWTYRQLCQTIGPERIWPILDLYRESPARPQTTIYYGAKCGPDAYQASLFAEFPEVEGVPLPTRYHNSAAYLRSNDQLMPSIIAQVQKGLDKRDRSAGSPSLPCPTSPDGAEPTPVLA